MSSNSAIEWTDHTFNPWWGCVKIAQGCKNCYAEDVATRFHGRKVWGPNSERKMASERVWSDPMRWNATAQRLGRCRFKVFCLSMGDVLEDHPALVEPRKRLAGLIEHTPLLDWQLLTKRPENFMMLGWGNDWPKNVWFGASAAQHDELVAIAPALIACPAGLKFLSLEPLIGPIDLGGINDLWPSLDWIIIGGESGPQARHCDAAWILAIASYCDDNDVPYFVKQVGTQSSLPNIKHSKGGDWNEWPDDLRVREFPYGI